MEINLGTGIGDIVFGMKKDLIIKKIGTPDKISETEAYDGLTYYYNDLMVKLVFDRDKEEKLFTIIIYNEQCKLYNEYIIGKLISEVENLLKKQGVDKFEYEDYETIETMDCDEICVSFQNAFGRVECFSFTPFFDSEGEIIWPTYDEI